MNFNFFIVFFIFSTYCNGQIDLTYSVENYKAHEINSIVDSIWHEVVSWDGDTSQMIIQKREQYASDLENYYLEHRETNTQFSSPEGKALLYSFFIRHRNHDKVRIIESFNTILSGISPELWHYIYPIYSKNLKIEYKDGDAWIDTLDIQATSATNELHKIIMWNDIARYYYINKFDMSQAKIYFNKIVDNERLLSDGSFKDIKIQAKSFVHQIDNLQNGSKAPDFCSQDINNNEICFNPDQNKVVLIEFWATWCRPCIAELPIIKQIYEAYNDRSDFQMIGISLDKDIQTLRKFIEEQNMEWPQIFEGADKKRKGEITLLYNGFSLPTYYVIGKDGLIYYGYNSSIKGVDIKAVVDNLMK